MTGCTKVRPHFEKKPSWLKMFPVGTEKYHSLKKDLRFQGLHTVCEEARCPNIGECWAVGTATIMILGDVCTRACRFCNVKTGNPKGVVDEDEPYRVAENLSKTDLKYVVITCVDRDDLPDGGAFIFAETIRQVKKLRPKMKVEALVSDYRGNEEAFKILLDCPVDVLAHNVETVRALTPMVRDGRADYDQSLALLDFAKQKNPNLLTKSSIMVGLGETMDELKQTTFDLKEKGVDIVTYGQYLRPSQKHLIVKRYYFPDEFEQLKSMAYEMGFLYVASGPLVRSSYKAAELFALKTLS